MQILVILLVFMTHSVLPVIARRKKIKRWTFWHKSGQFGTQKWTFWQRSGSGTDIAFNSAKTFKTRACKASKQTTTPTAPAQRELFNLGSGNRPAI